MRLVLTCVALLAAAGLIAGLMGEEERPWRMRYGSAATAAVIAVAMALGGANTWSGIQGFHDRSKGSSGIDVASASVAGGAKLGLNTAFLYWARARIPANGTFYLYPAGPASDAATYQWSTYQLAPRLSVDKPDEADWLVFYGVDPAKTDYDSTLFGPPVRYEPKFYLASRRAG
jgi:hypothetical protein